MALDQSADNPAGPVADNVVPVQGGDPTSSRDAQQDNATTSPASQDSGSVVTSPHVSPTDRSSGTPGMDASTSLVRKRMGPFAGLFSALRAKHPPTADHCLRVAIICSKWAAWRGMDDAARSLLEVAGLLHDIGKIGISDEILQKQTRLELSESLQLRMQVDVAEELLSSAGASPTLIAIVKQACDQESELEPSVKLLEARMLAIADAWDAMVTEQPFRPAYSRERAVEELFSHTGVQFDHDLVVEFTRLISKPRPQLDNDLARRWLAQVAPELPREFECNTAPVPNGAVRNLIDSLFHYRLLDALPIAAIYLNAAGQVLYWNPVAERLTGHRAISMIHHPWSPDLMGLVQKDGKAMTEETDPVAITRRTNARSQGRFRIRRNQGDFLMVDLSTHPVFHARELAGIIILASDVSEEVTLQKTIDTLSRKVCTDALTKVANRAELDRQLPKFVEEHLTQGSPGALIICDIDFFKKINDTFGHQAGDDALVTFASILREAARSEDLVARYGGEEFVILCRHCDNASATARAEQMRRKVERTPIPSLNGSTMTGSFGVTEVQPGDTPDTLLARADRALMTAKENGRNRVVQLGVGQDLNAGEQNNSDDYIREIESREIRTAGPWWRGLRRRTVPLLKTEYLTAVPFEVALEKIKGFTEDHRGQINVSDDQTLTIRIENQKNKGLFRFGDRPAAFFLKVTMTEVQYRGNSQNPMYTRWTKLSVVVHTDSTRDRRREAVRGQSKRLLHSFRAYLVAQPIDEEIRTRIVEPRS